MSNVNDSKIAFSMSMVNSTYKNINGQCQYCLQKCHMLLPPSTCLTWAVGFLPPDGDPLFCGSAVDPVTAVTAPAPSLLSDLGIDDGPDDDGSVSVLWCRLSTRDSML